MSTNSLAEMQSAVHQWISQWEEGYFSPLSNLARLTEEVGELARVVNHHFGDKPPKRDEARGELADEMGDVLFVLIALANQTEVDLGEALEATLKKYGVRDADRYERREG